MQDAPNEERFQVDLAGIIGLLSDHIYSGPHVYLRELIQNSVDAIAARRHLEPEHPGTITIRVDEDDDGPRLSITDDGIGLDESEIHRFLATIGQSAKRGALGDRGDYIGQFGVGLLSAFVVSDVIEVFTRKRGAAAEAALWWQGRRDGTYRVSPADEEVAEGTRVVLRPRPEMTRWVEPKRVLALGRRFARLLPSTITLEHGSERHAISGTPPPWRSSQGTAEQLAADVLAFGHEVLGARFTDPIPLRSDAGDVHGVAFVRPTAIDVAAPQRHRVYVKGMLVSESSDNILPPWAGFVQAIVDAKGLRPTASREHLYEDDALLEAREALGGCIEGWLRSIAKARDGRLGRLMATHAMALRNYALHDDTFLSIIMDEFVFETNKGHRRFGELRAERGAVAFAATVEEFRQVAPIALAQGVTLINAGHTQEVELLTRAAEQLDGVEVRRFDAQAMLDRLEELSLDERRAAGDFLEVATPTLAAMGVEAELRAFSPSGLPALYVCDEETAFTRSAARTKEEVNPLWAGALDDLLSARAAPAPARLVFNIRNPLVQRLLRVDDPDLLGLVLRLLYVQTLLLAQRPLATHEVDILNDGLLQLIERSVGPAGGMLQ